MMIFKCGQTYIYIYKNIDRRGTKTILGPARTLRARAGKRWNRKDNLKTLAPVKVTKQRFKQVDQDKRVW